MDDQSFGRLVRAESWRKRLRGYELARLIGQSPAFVQAVQQGRWTDPVDADTVRRGYRLWLATCITNSAR
jgi:hypothetical protein